jgi:hypothetical protein
MNMHIDGWMDGWMDGWTDGRTDGQVDRYFVTQLQVTAGSEIMSRGLSRISPGQCEALAMGNGVMNIN